MCFKDCIAGLTLLVVLPSAWAGAQTTSLRISMTLLDRCLLNAEATTAGSAHADCSPGVAKVVLAPPSPEGRRPPGEATRTSQPLPKNVPPDKELVAVVF